MLCVGICLRLFPSHSEQTQARRAGLRPLNRAVMKQRRSDWLRKCIMTNNKVRERHDRRI